MDLCLLNMAVTGRCRHTCAVACRRTQPHETHAQASPLQRSEQKSWASAVCSLTALPSPPPFASLERTAPLSTRHTPLYLPPPPPRVAWRRGLERPPDGMHDCALLHTLALCCRRAYKTIMAHLRGSSLPTLYLLWTAGRYISWLRLLAVFLRLKHCRAAGRTRRDQHLLQPYHGG